MLIDIVNPGWAPVYISNLTEDIPGYIEAPANALAYPWKHFIGGHLGRLGTRDDVTLHQQYMADIAESSRNAIDTVDPTPYFVKYGENIWAAVKGYLDAVTARRRRTGDREVHRRARRRRRVHREHDVLGDGVDPPRPRLRLAGAPLMASLPVRDPVGDHLLTPQNAALVVIDYQPSQFAAVRSMDPDLLLENIVSTVKTAKAFDMPIVHSTINVATGRSAADRAASSRSCSRTIPPIDRTSTNAWEDAEFLAAVRATGRRKLILCALWTEICMAFPALDALREGYEVYPVVDAIGGTSEEAHRAGTRARRAGRRAAGHLGRARRRAAARLGARGDGRRRDRDRAHRDGCLKE